MKSLLHILWIILFILNTCPAQSAEEKDKTAKIINLSELPNSIWLGNSYPGEKFGLRLDSLLRKEAEWIPYNDVTPFMMGQHNEILLKIKLPKIPVHNPALLVSYYSNNFELFLNLKKIYSCGTFNPEQSFKHNNIITIPLDSAYQGKNLILRICYKSFLDIGNFDQILLGSYSDIADTLSLLFFKQLRLKLYETIAAFFQIAIGILSFIIFLIRLKKRESIFLFFSIFAICSGISNCLEFIKLFINIPLNTFFYSELFISFLIPFGFLGLIKGVTQNSTKSLINYAVWISFLTAFVSLLLPITWPITYLFWGESFIYMLICIRALIIAKLFQSKSFRLPLISILFFLASSFIDILLYLELPNVHLGLYNWSMLFLILAFAIYIEKHYQRTTEKILEYSMELEKTQNHLLHLEKENLLTQYEVLKNQVNPHFLFNSLNILSSLIRSNQSKAITFVEEFADLYRYVLDVHDKYVIEIKQEIEFINSYIYLQKIRYEDNLSVTINIHSDSQSDLIMPLSLQILIENAIKHNEISAAKPLRINIESFDDFIRVTNNLQKVESTFSKGIGLKNLKERYTRISDIAPKFSIEGELYIAQIPIIKAELL